MSRDDVIWDGLRDVLDRYRVRLGVEATLLRELLVRLQATPAARAELKAFLHRVGGTAGSFEMDAIFKQAKALEARLDAGASVEELLQGGAALVALLADEAVPG